MKYKLCLDSFNVFGSENIKKLPEELSSENMLKVLVLRDVPECLLAYFNTPPQAENGKGLADEIPELKSSCPVPRASLENRKSF